MVNRRIILSVAFLLAGIGGIYLGQRLWLNRVSADYVAGNFTAGANGTTYAFDSATNVFMGSFTLPNPVSDISIIDGAGNTVLAKDPLTAFSASNKLFDTNNNGLLDSGEGILLSADSIVDASDTVITPAANALTTIITSESDTLIMYLDHGTVDNQYTIQEDIYRQVYSGSGGTTADGSTIRTFEPNVGFFELNANSLLDFASISTYVTESIIRDTDGDGALSSGDTIIASGYANIRALLSVNKVCFDDSTADLDYGSGEVIWFDDAGNCSAFTSGTDIVLVGASLPTASSILFGIESAEQEVGYFDADTSGTYSCSRLAGCESLFYSGVDGQNINTGSQTAVTNVFFDRSTVVSDGIAIVYMADPVEDIVDLNTLLSVSDATFVYIDANTNNNYDNGEDIFQNVLAGSATVAVTGNTIRTFDDGEKALLTPGMTMAQFDSTNGAIIASADSNLSAGLLGVTGTDKVLSPGIALDALPSTNKYFDSDTAGAYIDGDDIVFDSDNSGYYNADDLMSLSVVAAGSDPISDSYLSGVFIYQRVGNDCVGLGTDNSLGFDGSSPFLGQQISINKLPYATADAVASRTLCVYANIANNGVHGKVWTLEIPANGAIFASSSSSPTSAFTSVTGPVQFVAPLNATITASSSRVSASSTYTFTYTLTEDEVDENNGLLAATFPSGFNVAGANATCLDDGVPVTVTSSRIEQTIYAIYPVAVPVSAPVIATNSIITCAVSGVTNPSTVGTTGAFTVAVYAASATRSLYADIDNTHTITAASSGGGGGSVAVANTVTLLSPNGGESYAVGDSVPLTWSTTGSGISYANLAYSVDNGTIWTSIATNQANNGVYSWIAPDVTSSAVLVKVEGTDLVSVVDDDVSDAVFAISGTSEAAIPVTSTEIIDETAGEETIVETPVVEEQPVANALSSGIFVKLEDSTTVYAIDNEMVRHPFLDAQTYLTYQESFDSVYVISEDLLNESSLGDPEKVNPGTILVKFISEPTVYTVNEDANDVTYLRPVPNEETAVSVYGTDWNTKVIDLSDDVRPYYTIDSTNETADSLAMWSQSGRFTDRWHLVYSNASQDLDGDGAATWLEASWGTSPYDPDMDADGYNDKLEVDTGHSPFAGGGV